MSRRLILVLDTVLLLLTLLILAPRLTHLAVHEWLGLALVPLLLAHLLLSWRWLRGATRGLLRAPARAKINYLLNAALFILVILAVLSGVLVSQVALPRLGIRTINDLAWVELHYDILNGIRLCIALHLAMNWGWITTTFRLWNRPPPPAATAPLLGQVTRIVGRSLVLVGASGLVTLVAWLLVGAPNVSREFVSDAATYLAGSPWRGARQLVSQGVLLGVGAFVGRRWLRVRL